MSRRLGRCAAWLTALLVSGMLAACGSGPVTGPAEIKWDRQTCERCQMVVSERRHAAQLRFVGERRAYAFDDLGCALLWLDDRDGAAGSAEVEVWVRDAAGERWVDGHESHYGRGHHTPMQYGWAIARKGVSLEEVHARVRETEQQRRREGARSGGEAGGRDG